MDVSIIIVNWNTRERLRECLQSLRECSYDGLTGETWVVDNASHDGSAAMARADFPEAQVLENAENVGFARANNQALAQAAGRHLLLLNSDCVALPGAIGAMSGFLDAHPKAGAAGCRLLNGDGSVQRSAWLSFPTLGSVASGGLWLDKIPILRNRLAREQRELARATEPTQVAHLLGACLMARREAVEQVGMLDDQYFMYLEETDWCRRFSQSGWSVWLVPSGSIIHYGQQSAGLAPDKATADWCRSMCRFYRAAYGAGAVQMSLLKLAIAASVCLRFAVSQARPRGKRPSWAGTARALQALRAA